MAATHCPDIYITLSGEEPPDTSASTRTSSFSAAETHSLAEKGRLARQGLWPTHRRFQWARPKVTAPQTEERYIDAHWACDAQ